ncbi:hypothetical protein OG21DRAFT_1495507 [Imleria badia]|nr:hypothetical protein OG21DRAFT_1495507 [Imleria badia]
MPSYVELIRQDVVHHEPCDASSWPSYVLEFAQFLQNELKIPSWFKADDDSGSDLLAPLCMSDDPNNDLWDSSMDGEIDQRLRTVFNTALSDCARIQAVVKAECLTETLYPKESFLVILVRNVMLEAHERLSALEDAPVVLPRHSSGQEIPLLSFVKKTFYAPLVVSVNQEMPVEEDEPDLGQQLDDEENSSDKLRISCTSLSMSEWLKLCERPQTPEEEEEALLSPQFEAYFLAYPPSATPPAVCNIPVLCMADAEQLPILLTSLLYQRRVWHISDPLVGLQFSKYDTTIRLFVGWLDDDDSSSSSLTLPRAHVGEIRTRVVLNLSSPSVVLVVSRLLCSLESHIRGVRDTASRSVGAVIPDTQSDPSLAWRIDTDGIQEEGSAPIPENNNTRDMIIRWLKTQRCSAGEDNLMQTRKRGDKSSSATSSSTPHGSTSGRSYQPPPSSYTSEGKRSSVAKSQNSDATSQSQKSCSKFVATSEDDYALFRWMFDRRVVPQPVINDMTFREEYSAMTSLIWPETWNSSEDLPSVDPALQPCVEDLLKSIDVLKRRPGAVKCVPVEEFPINLRIFEHSFSAIFQASRRSLEKTGLSEDICEAAWRHDHDRLLFDFFIRLVQPKKGHTLQSLIDRYSVANLEDPCSRPILETTLRLPTHEDTQTAGQRRSLRKILRHEAADLEEWLHSREGPPLHIELGHGGHADNKWISWNTTTSVETKVQALAALSQAPATGVCDALGRLLVELPNVSAEAVRNFQLVERKSQVGKKTQKVKAAASTQIQSEPKSLTFRGQGEKVSGSSPVPATDSESFVTKKDIEVTPIPYTMPSSSAPISMFSVNNDEMGSSKSPDGLADKIQQLQLNTDASSAYLELPILTAEYKKADENSIQGTNQLRMYLTAAVKFLQAIGIMNFAVYGVQTDGPIVVLPAAIVRDDNYVYLYERLTEKLDISTPVGAWHYATILCRLAQNHAKILQEKFEEQVRDRLVTSLKKGERLESWTMAYQRAEWLKHGVKQADKSEDVKEPMAQRE